MGIPVVSISLQSLVAVSVVLLFSMVHYHSLKVGSRVQNLLTLFKIGIVVAFIAAGFLSENGTAANFMLETKSTSGFAEKFAVSLIFISFAYAGWNASAYIGGEIKNPGRNIPLSLLIGTLFVTGLYLLLNVVYIYALTPAQMSGAVDVGARAAISLFGENVSKVASGAIAIGLLSVLSAMIMTGPRVYYAMSKDKLFFELFAKVSKSRHTPAHSIFLQAGIAIVLIITASYEKLLIYIGFTLSLFALLTVAGLVRLRLKDGPNPNGYRTFGYPLTPLIFIFGNLWIIWFSVKSRPVPALCGIATIGIGLCAYLYFKRRQSRPLTAPGASELVRTPSSGGHS
jgi:APA family basic amino acid/polyamine antiporter